MDNAGCVLTSTTVDGCSPDAVTALSPLLA
jgi:hypothetical protein